MTKEIQISRHRGDPFETISVSIGSACSTGENTRVSLPYPPHTGDFETMIIDGKAYFSAILEDVQPIGS